MTDEEIIEFAEKLTPDTPMYSEGYTPYRIVKELLRILKKWRSKALMREQRIKELEKLCQWMKDK